MKIILCIIIIICIYVWKIYNELVTKKKKVEQSHSTIDVYLMQRFDLIPNLIECVKAYTKHESETLEKVIQARNSYLKADTKEDKMKTSDELSKCVSQIFALSESYPELKANENFIQLQEELKNTEDKISYARQFYNDSVLIYNNNVETFPSNIIANMFGFQKEMFFEATETERENVKVKF